MEYASTAMRVEAILDLIETYKDHFCVSDADFIHKHSGSQYRAECIWWLYKAHGFNINEISLAFGLTYGATDGAYRRFESRIRSGVSYPVPKYLVDNGVEFRHKIPMRETDVLLAAVEPAKKPVYVSSETATYKSVASAIEAAFATVMRREKFMRG